MSYNSAVKISPRYVSIDYYWLTAVFAVSDEVLHVILRQAKTHSLHLSVQQ